MAQTVFQRIEQKYLIDTRQLNAVMSAAKDRVHPDQYGKSTVCSVYFDTPDYRLIRESIEKTIYKEKLRLRCYGLPNADSTVFVELKRKFDGVVYKRRVVMKYADAHDYLYEDHKPEESQQVHREIDYFIKTYENIAPMMFISYDRVAAYGDEDVNLRITIDNNILWRADNVDCAYGIGGEALLLPGQSVMEIKGQNAMPLWLAKALDENAIYPCGYSKYGNAYRTMLKEGRIDV